MEDESEESDEGSEDKVLPAAAEEEGDEPAAAEEDDEPAPVFCNIFEIMAHNPFIDDGSGYIFRISCDAVSSLCETFI